LDDRGLEVPLGHDLEQRGCGLGRQREISQFVDREQGWSGVEAHGGGPSALDRGPVAAGCEVGGGGEVGAVAGVDGLAGQTCGEHGLADPGGPDHQDVGGGLEVAAGRQVVDQPGIDARLGVVVELVQGRVGGQAREAEPAGEPSGLGGGDLDPQQPFQSRGHGEVLGPGLVQHGGQGRGRVDQLEGAQVSAQLLVAAVLGRGGRRRRVAAGGGGHGRFLRAAAAAA
jgi:hypothetical protein